MHPHELLSEAAVMYDRFISGTWRWSIYLAAVGEPALGPVAYVHRPSAINDPTAPLGHHAQDVTHESFGVATLGVFNPKVHLEASVFNGTLPNEVRTNFDYAGARLNSFSARLTLNPDARWSFSGSAAYLAASTGAHSHDALHRLALFALRIGDGWAASLLWATNVPTDTRRVQSTALLEATVDIDARNAVFGRAEYVTRTDEELGLVGSVSDEVRVGSLALGYARRLGERYGLAAWVGARGDVNFVPPELRIFYGSRTPAGFLVYLQIRPSRTDYPPRIGRPAAKSNSVARRKRYSAVQ